MQTPSQIIPIRFLKNRKWLHIFYWAIISLFFIGLYVNIAKDKYFATFLVFEFCLIFIITYFNVLIFIPKLFYKKKKIVFFLITFLFLVIISIFEKYIVSIIIYPLPNYNELVKNLSISNSFMNFFFYCMILLLVKIGKDSLIIQHEQEVALKQKSMDELQFLKAQLSPHFLLNTMNNLYGLSVSKSDKLPSLILVLSDLLRYSIYNNSDIYISINEELKYLKDYITLQSIRLNNEDIVSTNFPDVIDNSKKILPLILIVFIENAFKHADINDELTIPSIQFSITIDDNFLYFTAINNYEPKEAQTTIGIGLQNTIKRIELLCGKESLPIVDIQNGKYKVSLKLKLHTND
jgi:LytS/YehU family sensor histidine kinase